MYGISYDGTAGGIEKNFEIKKDAPQPPALKDSETLVQVSCASLNPVDYKFPEAPLVGRFGVGLPATPAIDYAGVVASTKNPELSEGQRVFGRLDMPQKFGVIAEYTVAPAAGCVALPDGVSFAQAAAIGTAGLTAWQTIAPYVKDKPAGQRVLLNGGSGGKNAAFCKELGADEVIEYNSVDVSKTLIDKVKSDPKLAYDLAIDNAGSPSDLYKAADYYLKPEGPFVQVAASPTLSGGLAMANRAIKPSFLGGGKRKWQFAAVKNKAEDFEAMGEFMQQRKMKSIIDSTFSFEDAAKAYEKLKTGRAKGKIIVNVGDA